jgi:hypothetical protein
VWARRLETPLRQFLRTETGSAAVLLAATLAALAWANIEPSGYAATWHTVLMIRSGTRGLADSRGRPGQVLADARPAAGPQGALTGKDLIRYAGELGLDTDQFTRNLRNHAGQAKIAADVDSADLSGVSGTPTFFVNGKRHHGAYDISTLSDAVRTARTQILINSPRQPRHTP